MRMQARPQSLTSSKHEYKTSEKQLFLPKGVDNGMASTVEDPGADSCSGSGRRGRGGGLCLVSKLSVEAPAWIPHCGAKMEADGGHFHDGSNKVSFSLGLFPRRSTAGSKLAIVEDAELACSTWLGSTYWGTRCNETGVPVAASKSKSDAAVAVAVAAAAADSAPVENRPWSRILS